MSRCSNSTAYCMHDPECEDTGCPGRPAKVAPVKASRPQQFEPDLTVRGPYRPKLSRETRANLWMFAALASFAGFVISLAFVVGALGRSWRLW